MSNPINVLHHNEKAYFNSSIDSMISCKIQWDREGNRYIDSSFSIFNDKKKNGFELDKNKKKMSEQQEWSSKTVVELKQICKGLGLPTSSRLRKDDLIKNICKKIQFIPEADNLTWKQVQDKCSKNEKEYCGQQKELPVPPRQPQKELPIPPLSRISETTATAATCKIIDFIKQQSCTADIANWKNNPALYQKAYKTFSRYREQTAIVLLAEATNSCIRGEIGVFLNNDRDKYFGVVNTPQFDKYYKLSPPSACVKSSIWVVRLSVEYVEKLSSADLPLTEAKLEILKNRTDAISHSMTMIIDRDRKQIEVFDPNGQGDVETVFIALRDTLSEKDEFKGYTWLEPWMSCVSIGPQGKTKTSDCAHWSLLYSFIRVRCPQVRPLDLQKHLVSIPSANLWELMMHWMCFLRRYANERGILFFGRIRDDFLLNKTEFNNSITDLHFSLIEALNAGDLQKTRAIFENIQQAHAERYYLKCKSLPYTVDYYLQTPSTKVVGLKEEENNLTPKERFELYNNIVYQKDIVENIPILEPVMIKLMKTTNQKEFDELFRPVRDTLNTMRRALKSINRFIEEVDEIQKKNEEFIKFKTNVENTERKIQPWLRVLTSPLVKTSSLERTFSIIDKRNWLNNYSYLEKRLISLEEEVTSRVQSDKYLLSELSDLQDEFFDKLTLNKVATKDSELNTKFTNMKERIEKADIIVEKRDWLKKYNDVQDEIIFIEKQLILLSNYEKSLQEAKLEKDEESVTEYTELINLRKKNIKSGLISLKEGFFKQLSLNRRQREDSEFTTKFTNMQERISKAELVVQDPEEQATWLDEFKTIESKVKRAEDDYKLMVSLEKQLETIAPEEEKKHVAKIKKLRTLLIDDLQRTGSDLSNIRPRTLIINLPLLNQLLERVNYIEDQIL